MTKNITYKQFKDLFYPDDSARTESKLNESDITDLGLQDGLGETLDLKKFNILRDRFSRILEDCFPFNEKDEAELKPEKLPESFAHLFPAKSFNELESDIARVREVSQKLRNHNFTVQQGFTGQLLGATEDPEKKSKQDYFKALYELTDAALEMLQGQTQTAAQNEETKEEKAQSEAPSRQFSDYSTYSRSSSQGSSSQERKSRNNRRIKFSSSVETKTVQPTIGASGTINLGIPQPPSLPEGLAEGLAARGDIPQGRPPLAPALNKIDWRKAKDHPDVEPSEAKPVDLGDREITQLNNIDTTSEPEVREPGFERPEQTQQKELNAHKHAQSIEPTIESLNITGSEEDNKSSELSIPEDFELLLSGFAADQAALDLESKVIFHASTEPGLEDRNTVVEKHIAGQNFQISAFEEKYEEVESEIIEGVHSERSVTLNKQQYDSNEFCQELFPGEQEIAPVYKKSDGSISDSIGMDIKELDDGKYEIDMKARVGALDKLCKNHIDYNDVRIDFIFDERGKFTMEIIDNVNKTLYPLAAGDVQQDQLNNISEGLGDFICEDLKIRCQVYHISDNDKLMEDADYIGSYYTESDPYISASEILSMQQRGERFQTQKEFFNKQTEAPGAQPTQFTASQSVASDRSVGSVEGSNRAH